MRRTIQRIKSKSVKIPMIDEAIPQRDERIVPRIPPKKILPVCWIPARIAEASERSPSETIGEKSILPILRKPIRENSFM